MMIAQVRWIMFILTLLLWLLDADDFGTREGTQAILQVHADLVWRELESVQGSVEMVQRCRVIHDAWFCSLPLDKRQFLASKLRPIGWTKLPWLSSLPEWNRCYLDQATATGFLSSHPDWPSYREATRLWILDMVEAGHVPRELQTLLEMLAEGEREWCKKHGAPPSGK